MRIQTFGYRYGSPNLKDCDMVFDARCLAEDPAEKASLGHLTGQDKAVQDYLAGLPDVQRFIAGVFGAMDGAHGWVAVKERGFQNIAVACHSGRHRSVYIAEQVADRLRQVGVTVTVEHLDMDRKPDEDLAPDFI